MSLDDEFIELGYDNLIKLVSGEIKSKTKIQIEKVEPQEELPVTQRKVVKRIHKEEK